MIKKTRGNQIYSVTKKQNLKLLKDLFPGNNFFNTNIETGM